MLSKGYKQLLERRMRNKDGEHRAGATVRCYRSKFSPVFSSSLYYSRAGVSPSRWGLGYYFKAKESADVIGRRWGLFGEESEESPHKHSSTTLGLKVKPAARQKELLSSSVWGHLCHCLSSWGVQQLCIQLPKHSEEAFPKVPQELGKLPSLWRPEQDRKV